MAEPQHDNIIQRKINASRALLAEGSPGADRGWRLALARAARDKLSLPLEVTALVLHKRSLPELLELPQQHALIAVLQGPAESMGLLIVAPAVLAAMIEAQTLGKVSTAALLSRKPTRTDAAMVAPTLDAALEGLEQSLALEADLHWAGGFRYASFLDDPRPLGLLLEDTEYKVVTADLSLGFGARQGAVLLALPADGKGTMPTQLTSGPDAEMMAAAAFAQALSDQVAEAACLLDAVISRVSLPLNRILDLGIGELIALPSASIDRVHFESVDGRVLAGGRLGQNRGMRAIRLADTSTEARTKPGAEIALVAEPMRQKG